MPVSPGGAAPVTSVFGRTGAVALQSSDVTTALNYTPVNPADATFTAPVLLANGTAASPALSWAAETNMGFYGPSGPPRQPSNQPTDCRPLGRSWRRFAGISRR